MNRRKLNHGEFWEVNGGHLNDSIRRSNLPGEAEVWYEVQTKRVRPLFPLGDVHECGYQIAFRGAECYNKWADETLAFRFRETKSTRRQSILKDLNRP